MRVVSAPNRVNVAQMTRVAAHGLPAHIGMGHFGTRQAGDGLTHSLARGGNRVQDAAAAHTLTRAMSSLVFVQAYSKRIFIHIDASNCFAFPSSMSLCAFVSIYDE